MATIDFPSNPAEGDLSTQNGRDFRFDGTTWIPVTSVGSSDNHVRSLASTTLFAGDNITLAKTASSVTISGEAGGGSAISIVGGEGINAVASGSVTTLHAAWATAPEARLGDADDKVMSPERVGDFHDHQWDSISLSGYTQVSSGDPADVGTGQYLVSGESLTIGAKDALDTGLLNRVTAKMRMEVRTSAGIGLTGRITSVAVSGGVYTIALSTPYNGNDTFTGNASVLIEGDSEWRRRTQPVINITAGAVGSATFDGTVEPWVKGIVVEDGTLIAGSNVQITRGTADLTISATALTGPAGPQGPAGEKGDKGDTGDTGPAGPAGAGGVIEGSRGVVADTIGSTTSLTLDIPYVRALASTTIFAGDNVTLTNTNSSVTISATALTGPAGPQGPAGEKGDKGDTGDQGPAGATGAQGPAGEKGDKGDTGDTGPAGATGPQGPAGANGVSTISGATDTAFGTPAQGDLIVRGTGTVGDGGHRVDGGGGIERQHRAVGGGRADHFGDGIGDGRRRDRQRGDRDLRQQERRHRDRRAASGDRQQIRQYVHPDGDGDPRRDYRLRAAVSHRRRRSVLPSIQRRGLPGTPCRGRRRDQLDRDRMSIRFMAPATRALSPSTRPACRP